MGVLNLPQYRTPEQGAQGVTLLTTLLSPLLKDRIERANAEEAKTGLEALLNPVKKVETPTPMETTPEVPAKPMGGLSSLLTPAEPAKETPAIPFPTNAPKSYTTLRTPQPGDEDYQTVPSGLSQEAYGTLANTIAKNKFPAAVAGSAQKGARLIQDNSGNYVWVYPGQTSETAVNTGITAPVNRQAKAEVVKGEDGKDHVYNMWYDPRNPSAAPVKAGEIRDPLEVAKARINALGNTRMQVVYDAQNNYSPRLKTINEITQEPDRYVPYMATQKALDKTALVNDMMRTVQNVRESLDKLPPFDAVSAGQIAEMMRSNNPKEVIGPYLQRSLGTTLTPEQAEYVVDLMQLRENSLAMRSVLNAGPGSDQLRDAILQTIPSATSPSQSYVHTQLNKYQETLMALAQGTPGVTLNQPGAAFQNQQTPKVSGKGAIQQRPVMQTPKTEDLKNLSTEELLKRL